MESNPHRAADDTANELAHIRHWAPIVIALAAAMILGVTCFIWMDVVATL